MITEQTVNATRKLYNKMFADYFPPCVRVSNLLKTKTIEVLRKYGRKKVCILFRFILSEIRLYGMDKFRFFSFSYLMTNFAPLLYSAYYHRKERELL